MSHLTVKNRAHKALLGPRATTVLKTLVHSRIPAIVLTGIIVAFALVFIPRLDVDSDQLFFFKDGDPVREAFEKTEEVFGGATPLAGEFVLEPSEGLEGIVRIAGVSREFEELAGVRRVFSVADIATTLSTEELTQLASGGVTLPLGEMVSADGLRFILFPSDFSTDDLAGWVAFAEATPEIRTLTGMPIIWDDIARLVLKAQMTSIVVAFILVALMLAVSYRNLRDTVISLVPIALTIATVLGFLAASGINLNLVTAVI